MSYFYSEFKTSEKGIKGIFDIKRNSIFAEYGCLNNKFGADKVNYEDKEILIHFDGVLLNDIELFEAYSAQSTRDLFLSMWKIKKNDLIAELKGSFVLLIWDKVDGCLLLTNDLLGKRDLYYYLDDGRLFYSEQFASIISLLKKNGVNLSINAEACVNMLDNGYLFRNETYVEKVVRLGSYEKIVLDIKNNLVQVKLDNDENKSNSTDIESLEKRFNELFEKAVELQYRKNHLYNYKQVSSLSGGMDSRACLLEAKKIGYDVDLCFSYSQSNSVDDVVSKKIANDLNIDLLYYQLDNGLSIRHMYDAMMQNECMQSGIGSTGAIVCAKALSVEHIGIIHTGLLGGELLGDLIKYKSSTLKYWICRMGLSTWGDCKYPDDAVITNLRACQNFSRMFISNCEVFSPFIDEDVVRFVKSIPPEFLIRRGFYRKWMNDYIPNSYFTTYFQGPITISPLREVLRKSIQRIKKKISLKLSSEMNPFELWFQTNEELRKETDRMYEEDIKWVREHHIPLEIIEDITKKWNLNIYSKYYVLTCTKALRLLYSEPL